LGKTTTCPAPLPAEPTYNFELGKFHCQKAFARKHRLCLCGALRSISLKLGFTKTRPQFSQILRSPQLLLPAKPSKPTNAFAQNSPQRLQAFPKPKTPNSHRNSQTALPNFYARRRPTATKPAQNFAQTLPTGNRFCLQILKLKTTLAL